MTLTKYPANGLEEAARCHGGVLDTLSDVETLLTLSRSVCTTAGHILRLGKFHPGGVQSSTCVVIKPLHIANYIVVGRRLASLPQTTNVAEIALERCRLRSFLITGSGRYEAYVLTVVSFCSV